MRSPMGMLAFGAVCAILTAILVLGSPAPAEAHVCIVSPASRVGADCSPRSPQKVGPCGILERGENVTRFRPGETITVVLNETIDHPSHFRISFDPDGSDFEDPVSIDDNTGAHPHVLLDGIRDADAARQNVEVTLPDVECDECTLQLIQVMHDKQGNGFGGRDSQEMDADDNDDIYYSCADLVLSNEAPSGDDVASTDEPEHAEEPGNGNGTPESPRGTGAAPPEQALASRPFGPIRSTHARMRRRVRP